MVSTEQRRSSTNRCLRELMFSHLLQSLAAISLSRTRFVVMRGILCVVVVLVALPRFDMNDLGVSAVTGDVTTAVSFAHGAQTNSSPDVRQYTALVQFFRGEQPQEIPAAPFAYRMLIPFAASLLPASPLTAIDLINLFVLVLCVLCVDALLAELRMSYVERGIGMTLFAVSFPVFYYGATGRVDAGGILLMLVIMYAHTAKNQTVLWTALVLAPAAKETTVIAVLYCLVMELREPGMHARRSAVLMVAVYVAATVLVRKISPVGAAHVWSPNMTDVMTNLVRPRAYISSVLAFGPPGVLALLELIKGAKDTNESFRSACSVAVAASLLTWAYSFVAAYTDGRFVWLSYPFLIPLAVLRVRRLITSA